MTCPFCQLVSSSHYINSWHLVTSINSRLSRVICNENLTPLVEMWGRGKHIERQLRYKRERERERASERERATCRATIAVHFWRTLTLIEMPPSCQGEARGPRGQGRADVSIFDIIAAPITDNISRSLSENSFRGSVSMMQNVPIASRRPFRQIHSGTPMIYIYMHVCAYTYI